jgi:hypothetical protein
LASETAKTPASKRLSRGARFLRDLDAVMKKHKIVDYAVVGLAEDGFKVKTWAAGEGEVLTAQSDAERIGAVTFRLDILKTEMVDYCRTELAQ